MYKGLKAQGMEYISVNQGDSAEVINKYAKETNFEFPIVMDKKGGDIAKMYGVMAYPTNYLIKDGKVFAKFVGFDEKAMKAAITKMGFKVD
jgi:thioredoxin-like negative regulator of GroEL